MLTLGTTLYALCLIFSLVGMALVDYRWKLVFWNSNFSRKTLALAMLGGILFFFAWDSIGVALGIFATNPARVVGLNVGSPNLPIEEVLFLTLLCYVSLTLLQITRRWNS